MSDLIYEHHSFLRNDKLCPFRLVHIERVYDCDCNWHKNIEFLLITHGCGRLRYGNQEMTFCEGDLIAVNTDTIHRLYSESEISYYYLIIDDEFCTENGIATANRVFSTVIRSESIAKLFCDVVSMFDAYLSADRNSSHVTAARVRVAVLALLVELCDSHSKIEDRNEKGNKNSELYVKKAITYMNNHYREPLTLDSISGLCGITKHYLAREFKRYTGQTVLTYLNALRCKNAQLLLADGKTVTEVAYECGFDSISYFSRTYKKQMGIPPSAAIHAKA